MFPDGFLLVLITLFVISFVTNATPFFGASYTLIATAELISEGFNLENFAVIVFVTGLGATVAKVVLYSGALGLRSRLMRNKNIRLFHDWLNRRSFFVALFITAFAPALPLDDYIYIGSGANKARLAPMLGVTFVAKLAKSTAEIFLEFNGILGLSVITRNVFVFSSLGFSIILSLSFVVLGIALYKLDWENFLKKTGVLRTKNV